MHSHGVQWAIMYVLRTGAHRENEVWTLVYLNEGEVSFKLFENADLVRILANSLSIFFSFHTQYSFTAVDRVVQRSLPKSFVNLYRDTAYVELTNSYGLFRR